MSDVWVVDGGLRRVEQASGGPVVHYIYATEQTVEVVTLPDHLEALRKERVDAVQRVIAARPEDFRHIDPFDYSTPFEYAMEVACSAIINAKGSDG
jgi:S-adenosylmethionine:diacylglycerol 3-amino-3-carboxypropyl transferase